MSRRALQHRSETASQSSHLLAELSSRLDTAAYWHGETESFDHAALVTTAAGNRWNMEGQPAVYLAGDVGLVLVEAGRHLGPSEEAAFKGVIWRVRVRLDSVLDLRLEPARRALRLEEPHWFLDRDRCRGVATMLRALGACQAIRVQSAGVPDVPGRWNLVLFPDLLEAPLAEVVSEPELVGLIRER